MLGRGQIDWGWLRKRPDVIHSLPAFFLAQLPRKGGHRKAPFGDLEEQLAIGDVAHLLGIGEISRSDGKLGGFFAFPISPFAVTTLAVFSIGLLSRRKAFRGHGNRILQLSSSCHCAPVSGAVDSREQTCRQHSQ